MITIEDQTDYSTEVQVLSIIRAEYCGAYRVHLWFSDDTDHTVDFAPFLLHACNPMTTKYLDKDFFEAFTVEYGNIHWNDYEMCFETNQLHNSKTIEYHGFG
jgi:hypothetical protein